MYPLALQPLAKANEIPHQKPNGVLTHLLLNYHEWQCIELALIGFTQHIRYQNMPVSLTGVSIDHLSAQRRYLTHWLYQPALKSQLRLDGNNRVQWPFTSSELVNWLLLICQSCISEEAIFIVAADAAGVEHIEWHDRYLEELNPLFLSNRSFTLFQRYYRDVITTAQPSLIKQLSAIQQQDYPLFPEIEH